MTNSLAPFPRPLAWITAAGIVPWLLALAAWQLPDQTPEWVSVWLLAGIFSATLPLGIAWLRWGRQAGRNLLLAVCAGLYPIWWQLALFWSDVLELYEIRSGLATAGLVGLFVIGLAIVTWYLERKSRRIELAQIDAALRSGPILTPHAASAEIQNTGPRIWNPLDLRAWYYGRGGRKLKQSTAATIGYTALFWILAMLSSQVGGCQKIYEMPAGGGKQQTVAQTVRIQKVIRKKFVINPLSAIKFSVPPIDEVKLQLQEVTAHQYAIGYGEGTGAGFAGGTRRGKVRLIRLEYDGGDWNLNLGIGGDVNMLMEYGLLTQQRVGEKTESLRIAQLASFPAEKSPPVVFLTGQGSLLVSNTDVKVLREYLRDKHGMLFVSAGSAHFHNQFLALMTRVLPDVRPVSIPLDDSIHRVPFALPAVPYVVPHGGKEALGWSADGRWLVYYHPGDISDAWADGHAGIPQEIYTACYQLGANVINYGHFEYAKWLQSKGASK